jgi:predicted O-methyltransferase YrrM
MRTIIRRSEWDRVYYHSRHRLFQSKMKNEPLADETKKVVDVISELVSRRYLPHSEYNRTDFLAFRDAVHKNFFIYWTAINPPMEHLLYALSDILQPANILGLGVFTGNPVVWSMGPAIQKHYQLEKLVGVELNPDHAQKGQENFNKISPIGTVAFLGRDGFEVIKEYPDQSVDLVYLDANGFDPATQRNSKNINYSLLKAAYPKIKPGGYAMCHNAYEQSFLKQAADYVRFTDDDSKFQWTVTIGIDEMGLEFSRKIQ